MYTIQSDILTAKINPIGAELSSLVSKKTYMEYIWQGDPNWWTGRAPILFPIVCAMKEGTYSYNGIAYDMPKHGFLLDAIFSVENAADSKIVFEYTDNKKTRKIYPFDFVFRAVFELIENKLVTTYSVKNLNNGPMYFSVGAHEAYRCPREEGETFEDYYLEFDKDAAYISEVENSAGLLSGEKYAIAESGSIVPLSYKLFKGKSLMLKNIPSSSVSLKSRKAASSVKIDFSGAPHLGVWTMDGAPFICIEPWHGLPDEAGHDGDIKNKYGIIALEADNSFVWSHAITINE